MAKKQRIDDILIARGLAADGVDAKALVMSGSVILENGDVVSSIALKVEESREIRIRQRKNDPYVSRAGRKLAAAVEHFNLASSISGSVCIDIGCSTGGFSDVLLSNNCTTVYAVDVGVSLLDWKIRSDPRVVVVEKQNARHVNETVIPEMGRVGVVVCDVSFITLKLVLPPSMALCKPGAVLCTLIKPQFECRRDEIGQGGIVRDPAVRQRVIDSTLEWFKEQCADWTLEGVIGSPITGHDGNQEYLMVARKHR
jgi:23S rRNA (cytidine1920-2'-O)/16S rRNA (cytidine1409-2'-O)-methyltransferase